jgi:hypothetical protein
VPVVPVGRTFSVHVMNEVMNSKIAPYVDKGWFCTREVEKTIHELIKVHTKFAHLTNTKVFQEIAIIPILFGNLSGGLQQLCIRKIFTETFFKRRGFTKTLKLDSPSCFQKRTARRVMSNSTSITEDSSPGQPSDRAFPREDDTIDILSLSEPEIQSELPDSTRARASSSSARLQMDDRRDDDNWSLRRDPTFDKAVSDELLGDQSYLELEISRNGDKEEAVIQYNDHSVMQNMLNLVRDASNTIEEMQEDIKIMIDENRTSKLTKDIDDFLSNINKLSEEMDGLAVKGNEDGEQQQVSSGDSRSNNNQVTIEIDRVPTEKNPLEDAQTDQEKLSNSNFFSDDDCSDDDLSSSSSSSNGGEEAFSYGNVFYASASQSLPSSANSPYHDPNHFRIVNSLTPEKILALCRQLGLPHGIRPLLELEAARLQLGLCVFGHKSIECDRGCEGEDNSDLSSVSSEEDEENDFSGSSMFPTDESDTNDSSLDDVDSDLSYEGVLRNHSSTSSSSIDVDGHGRRARNTVEQSEESHEWFSFSGGEDEAERVRRHVKENLADPDGFDASTDSSSEDEHQRPT